MEHAAPEKRNLGIVFQNYALFPHMTVYENLAFPLQMRRVPPGTSTAPWSRSWSARPPRASDWKYPSQLSGGQQQRWP